MDVFSQIGLVMIIGLAAKNAILIVEFSKAEHERGASLLDAALAGARLRLRPILMTAFAFILGVLPLVVATGAGAASRQILGTTVLGGMLAATVIAIFVIPATFYVSQRFSRRADDAGTAARARADRPCRPGRGRSAAAGGVPRRRHVRLGHGRSHIVVIGRSWPAAPSVPTTRARRSTPPEKFRGQVTPVEAASLADLPWWEVFGDPTLQALIQGGDRGQLRPAASPPRASRRRAPRSGSRRPPSSPAIGYNVNVQRSQGVRRVPRDQSNQFEPDSDNLFLGALSASWEIDIWGASAVATRRRLAQLLATEEGRRGVLLSLVSDVAQAYFELIELDARLEIARDDDGRVPGHLPASSRTGSSSASAPSWRPRGPRARWPSAAATIPEVESQIAAKENQISTLLGKNPTAIPCRPDCLSPGARQARTYLKIAEGCRSAISVE